LVDPDDEQWLEKIKALTYKGQGVDSPLTARDIHSTKKRYDLQRRKDYTALN